MSSDLHIHTNFSDGRFSPEEILTLAKQVKLKYIAISDHDTVDGLIHLYENNRFPAKAPYLIPSIEFSANHPTADIHILGYNIDIYNRNLSDKLSDVVEGRWMRFSAIMEKLSALGYPLAEAEVLKIAGSSRSISRSHIARAMVKRGYFSSVRAAFSEVLSKGRPAYVSHYRLEVDEIVSLIKGAGGVPVLAHPALVGDDILVGAVLDSGIEGLEAYYPQHDAAATERYLQMAAAHGLLVTGGSDFHGFPSREPTELGVFTVDDALGEALYRAD